MKEFDIYLRERLTKCDIIVYSIPYRDGITVFDRMILESCLENYILQKFVAVQTGSELVSHIDRMIKTCYERLNFGMTIGASAEVSIFFPIYPNHVSMELTSEVAKVLANTFEKAENSLVFAADPLLLYYGKSVGSGSSSLVLNQSIRNTLKNSIEQFTNGIAFTSSLGELSKLGVEQYKDGIIFVAELTNLCYRVHQMGETALQLAASIQEIELHYSLGGGGSDIVLDAGVDDTVMNKYFAAETAIRIIAEVTELISQYMEMPVQAIVFGAEAGSMLRRFRLLGEVDDDALSAMDEVTLDELDYIVLEE